MEIRQRGNQFVSSDGWIVETRGRGEIVYRKGFVAASVGAEMMVEGATAFVIYPKHVQPLWYSWKRTFSTADRLEICNRIRAAFGATGSAIEISP